MSSDAVNRFRVVNGDSQLWQRQGELGRIKQSYRTLLKQHHDLSIENTELQSKQRYHLLQNKLCLKAAEKLHYSHQELLNTKIKLKEIIDERNELSNRIECIQRDSSGAKLTIQRLTDELSNAKAEINLFYRQGKYDNNNNDDNNNTYTLLYINIILLL